MDKYKLLIVFAILLMLSSCSDYFEVDRPPQQPWGTSDDFDRAAIGAYSNVFSGDKWNIPYSSWHAVKSTLGDDVGFVTDPKWGWNRDTDVVTYEFEVKNVVRLYRAVAICNNALEFVDSKQGDPYPLESDSVKTFNVNRVIGELHFMRGFAYYLLQTTFGHTIDQSGTRSNDKPDIPMPTVFAKSLEDAQHPVIGNTQQVWDLITDDFLKAKELLPEAFIKDLMPENYALRATKYAAIGMLARTYFQKGEYAKAMAECDEIINSGKFDLTEDPIAAFTKTTATAAKEVIFYAPYFDKGLPPPQHLAHLTEKFDDDGNSPLVQCGFTENYMDSSTVLRIGWMTNAKTSDTTVTEKAWRDKRFTQLCVRHYPIKYSSKKTVDPGGTGRDKLKDITTIFGNKYFRGDGKTYSMFTNVPVIRLAEIYLTRAICRLKTGTAGYVEDYNIVAERAWDEKPGAAFTLQAFTPAVTVTEQDINDQRLIEMWNEADRVDYLRGLKQDIPNGERSGGEGSTSYASEDFVWTLPVSETAYNEALTFGQ